MLKSLSSLEQIIEGKVYTFLCDPNSPLNHVKDVLVKFLGYVQQIEDQVKAQQEQALKDKKLDEEIKSEEQSFQNVVEEPKAE